jgi:type II secretory pathway predicted ATPase ExeA/septal ring-binding cell division protein DamX
VAIAQQGVEPFSHHGGGFGDEELKRRIDLLLYLSRSSDEIILVRGESGSGKSVLFDAYLRRLGEEFVACAINGDGLTAARLLVGMAQSFAEPIASEKPSILSENLADRMVALQAEGREPLIAIDDAHCLSGDSLDTLLDLYETMGESGHLLKVVLFGDPSIQRLFDATPRMTKYRGEMRLLEVAPFNEGQTKAYIEWVFAATGIQPEPPLDEEAVRIIFEESGGNPARINDSARALLDRRAGGDEQRGGSMSLAQMGKRLRAIPLMRLLPWFAVALVLLFILLFQGQINQLVNGVDESDNGSEMAVGSPNGQEPVTGSPSPSAMPRGELPTRIVRNSQPQVSADGSEPKMAAEMAAGSAAHSAMGGLERGDDTALERVSDAEGGVASGQAMNEPLPTDQAADQSLISQAADPATSVETIESDTEMTAGSPDAPQDDASVAPSQAGTTDQTVTAAPESMAEAAASGAVGEVDSGGREQTAAEVPEGDGAARSGPQPSVVGESAADTVVVAADGAQSGKQLVGEGEESAGQADAADGEQGTAASSVDAAAADGDGKVASDQNAVNHGGGNEKDPVGQQVEKVVAQDGGLAGKAAADGGEVGAALAGAGQESGADAGTGSEGEKPAVVLAADAAGPPATAVAEAAETDAAEAQDQTTPSPADEVAEEVTVRDETWLLTWPRNAYTVQVMGSRQRQQLVDLAGEWGIAGEAAIFGSTLNGAAWYALVVGIDSDLNGARTRLTTFAGRSRDYTPWVRSVASIHAEIGRAD